MEAKLLALKNEDDGERKSEAEPLALKNEDDGERKEITTTLTTTRILTITLTEKQNKDTKNDTMETPASGWKNHLHTNLLLDGFCCKSLLFKERKNQPQDLHYFK